MFWCGINEHTNNNGDDIQNGRDMNESSMWLLICAICSNWFYFFKFRKTNEMQRNGKDVLSLEIVLLYTHYKNVINSSIDFRLCFRPDSILKKNTLKFDNQDKNVLGLHLILMQHTTQMSTKLAYK